MHSMGLSLFILGPIENHQKISRELGYLNFVPVRTMSQYICNYTRISARIAREILVQINQTQKTIRRL